MADAQNWVALWQGFENTPVEEDAKQKFVDKMEELYELEEGMELPVAEPDLEAVDENATAFAAFMISFFTGRTRDQYGIVAFYQRYVMTEDGKVVAPQSRMHFLMQLMVCSFMVTGLGKEFQGDSRESLKKLRVTPDGPVELVTNKEGEQSSMMRLYGLTAYPVLCALAETGFDDDSAKACQLGALLCITEGEERQEAREKLSELLKEAVGFELGEEIGVTWARILSESHTTQYGIFAFAMWAINIFK